MGQTRRGNIFRRMLGEGLSLGTVGVLIGVVAAGAVTRYLSALLFGLTPLDSVTFAAVSLLFAVVASVAAYIPARRATKVDPLAALRHE